MRRSLYDITADILEETCQNHNLAMTRIVARTGAHPYMLRTLETAGLIETIHTSRKRSQLKLTDKGRQFLTNYRALEHILPKQ